MAEIDKEIDRLRNHFNRTLAQIGRHIEERERLLMAVTMQERYPDRYGNKLPEQATPAKEGSTRLAPWPQSITLNRGGQMTLMQSRMADAHHMIYTLCGHKIDELLLDWSLALGRAIATEDIASFGYTYTQIYDAWLLR